MKMKNLLVILCLLPALANAGIAGSRTTATSDPGAQVCAPFADSSRFVRAVAVDTDGNSSALSNEVFKDVWSQVCWQNPTQNVDGTPLTDLASVTFFYSSSNITEDDFTDPDPVGILTDVSGVDSEKQSVTLLIGETGKPVTLQWDIAGEKQVQVVEYGKTTPIVTGNFNGDSWEFTPPQAGLFYTRARSCDTCPWANSYDQGFLYHFKLAAPSGGGIN